MKAVAGAVVSPSRSRTTLLYSRLLSRRSRRGAWSALEPEATESGGGWHASVDSTRAAAAPRPTCLSRKRKHFIARTTNETRLGLYAAAGEQGRPRSECRGS